MTQAAEAVKETTALAPIENDPAMAAVRAEERRFDLAQRKAAVYAKSSLVPKEYQNNIGNVLIAENMAHRMGADPLMVMQNLYIVHGKPGWSAVFLIGTFNSNGRFSAIKYRFKGEQGSDDWGCQAYCTELATKEEISGTWITWQIANAEGWVSKAGSKWRTIPEQMFRYRAATFLIRATAPEIGLGLLTKEELEDTYGATNGNSSSEPKAGISSLKDRLNLPAAEDATDDGEPPVIDGEPVLDPPADADADVTVADAKDADEGGIDKAESQLVDLRASAFDIYRGLKPKQKTEANADLGVRAISDLDVEELTIFIDKYGEE